MHTVRLCLEVFCPSNSGPSRAFICVAVLCVCLSVVCV